MRHAQVDTKVPISQIGLGTWQFGSREWGYGSDYDEQEAHAIVRRALELGVTLFDTAELYGRGRSERILGRALREADADPDAIFLATKIFPALPIAPVVEQRALRRRERCGLFWLCGGRCVGKRVVFGRGSSGSRKLHPRGQSQAKAFVEHAALNS